MTQSSKASAERARKAESPWRAQSAQKRSQADKEVETEKDRRKRLIRWANEDRAIAQLQREVYA